jgi:hypothetical protein
MPLDRIRSRSHERDRDKDRERERDPRDRDHDRDRERDRERGRPPARSPPPGLGPRNSRVGNPPGSSSRHHASSSNDFKRPRDSNPNGALSPGQISTASRKSTDTGAAPRSRRSPSPSAAAPAPLEIIPSDVDVPALIGVLTKHKAPVASWIEVVSRFRRRGELDMADEVCTLLSVIMWTLAHSRLSMPLVCDMVPCVRRLRSRV